MEWTGGGGEGTSFNPAASPVAPAGLLMDSEASMADTHGLCKLFDLGHSNDGLLGIHREPFGDVLRGCGAEAIRLGVLYPAARRKNKKKRTKRTKKRRKEKKGPPTHRRYIAMMMDPNPIAVGRNGMATTSER